MTEEFGTTRFDAKLAEIERAAAEDARRAASAAATHADKDRALEDLVSTWNRRLLASRLFDR